MGFSTYRNVDMFNSFHLGLLALVASCLTIANTKARPFVLDCCADTYKECATKCNENFEKLQEKYGSVRMSDLERCYLGCEIRQAREAINKTVQLVQENEANITNALRQLASRKTVQLVQGKIANLTTALHQVIQDTDSTEHYIIPYIGLVTSCASLLSALVGIFCCCGLGDTSRHTVDFRRPHTISPSPTTPARRRIREASRILHLYHSSAPPNPVV